MITIDLIYLINLLIIWGRVSGVLMFLPGLDFSDSLKRGKVALSVFLALLISEVGDISFGVEKLNYTLIIMKFSLEFLLGLSISIFSKLLIDAAEILGSLISMQSGFGSLMIINPTGAQSSFEVILWRYIANFMFLSLNLHFIVIKALVDSYKFNTNKLLENSFIYDLSSFFTNYISILFNVSFKLAASYIIIGIISNLIGGIISRLMPNVQIFNLTQPMQMLIFTYLMFILFFHDVTWYANFMESKILELYNLIASNIQ